MNNFGHSYPKRYQVEYLCNVCVKLLGLCLWLCRLRSVSDVEVDRRIRCHVDYHYSASRQDNKHTSPRLHALR